MFKFAIFRPFKFDMLKSGRNKVEFVETDSLSKLIVLLLLVTFEILFIVESIEFVSLAISEFSLFGVVSLRIVVMLLWCRTRKLPST